jgi:hypothetical protein
MTTEGTVTITPATGPAFDITPARARPAPVEAEREMHRPPYSDAWFVEGDDLRGIERLDLTIEVHDTSGTGIAGASEAVHDLIDALDTATLAEVPFGYFELLGILEWTRSPIEAGYRLDVRLLTNGWLPDDPGGGIGVM